MPRMKKKKSYATEIKFARQNKSVEIIKPTKQMNSQNGEEYYAATLFPRANKKILRGNNYFAAR
jgi:hypothetical protein